MSDLESFQRYCAVIGADPDDENVHLWYAAAEAMRGEQNLTLLCRGFEWHRFVDDLTQLPSDLWVEELCKFGLVPESLRGALDHLLEAACGPTPAEFLGEVLWRTLELEALNIDSLDDLATSMIRSTPALITALDCLRTGNDVSEAVLETFPVLSALRTNRGTSVEHTAPNPIQPFPLLEHLVDRSLTRKLLGLERRDISRFQCDDALSEAAFKAELKGITGLEKHGLMPLVRSALLFLDFSKGGSPYQRERWSAAGVDLTVHNEASALLLRKSNALLRIPRMRANPLYAEIVLSLVQFHGTVGQSIRGESPLTVFSGFVDFVRANRAAVAALLLVSEHEAVDLMVDMLHVINVCDTAAVREGLFDDELRFEMVALENLLRRMGKETSSSASSFDLDQFDLNDLETEETEELYQVRRQWLWDRLSRLRRGRISKGEPAEATVGAVEQISAEALRTFCHDFCRSQLWYCEVATSGLSALSQLKILGLSIVAAQQAGAAVAGQGFDISFEQMVESLEQLSGSSKNRYRLRLLESILRPLDLNEIFLGNVDLSATKHLLGSLDVKIGGRSAIALRFDTNDEAEALITLLVKYERRSTAAFHATLKTLCDLYGLRKDEFDRLANEANYLATMNAARTDKDRMLDHAKPGRILEIGPGGGVILDLLEARFPKSEIIGVDVSAMAVEALRQRKKLEGRKWTVLEADAFALPKHVEPNSVSTVVLCSVLHEIFSYVEHKLGEGQTSKFRLESVRDLVRACYAVLEPGGRLIIRDGIMPADELRLIEFLDPDGPQFFELFTAEFKGRKIMGEWLSDTLVRLSAPDAMEFLYCYTWGPESFPYEVREQYGVLPYDEYTESIVAWLSHEKPPILVPLEDEVRSYLQPGYPKALADKIILRDSLGAEVALPDSNCLIVIEKPS